MQIFKSANLNGKKFGESFWTAESFPAIALRHTVLNVINHITKTWQSTRYAIQGGLDPRDCPRLVPLACSPSTGQSHFGASSPEDDRPIHSIHLWTHQWSSRVALKMPEGGPNWTSVVKSAMWQPLMYNKPYQFSFCFSSPPTYRSLETDKNTHRICTEQECKNKRLFNANVMERKHKLTALNANGTGIFK